MRQGLGCFGIEADVGSAAGHPVLDYEKSGAVREGGVCTAVIVAEDIEIGLAFRRGGEFVQRLALSLEFVWLVGAAVAV